MIETISELFSITWVKNLVFSTLLLILFVIIFYSANRIFKKSKMADNVKKRTRKWSIYILMLMYALILIRIWAVSDLFVYFKNPIFSKLFNSFLALGILYLILFFVRRFINSLDLKIQEKHEYRKRVGYAAGFIYFIILIPIWAESTKQWATIIS
ncbi:MAG: hypothetical protein P8078_10275, partial [bacterium]